MRNSRDKSYSGCSPWFQGHKIYQVADRHACYCLSVLNKTYLAFNDKVKY